MTRMLILDDELAYARELAQMLARHNFAAEVAGSATDACNLLETATVQFDILLIDHRLGWEDVGIDLIGEFKRRLPDCDTVLFTGHSDGDIGERAYAAGATRYLRKDAGPSELLHILKEIEGVRTTRFERRWLETLTQVLEETQQTLAVPAMAEVLTAGACKLGFTRSRLYRVETDGSGQQWLLGLAQQGMVLPDFTQMRWPLAATYAQLIAHSEEKLVVFQGLEHGKRAVQTYYARHGNTAPCGEWVGVALQVEGVLLGILMLDNGEQVQALRPEFLSLLRMLARQAAAALNRAIRFEAEQIVREADAIMSDIVDELNEARQPSLDDLLRTVQTELEGAIPHGNLLVAFHHDGWLCERWHIEAGKPFPRRWHSREDMDLVTHVFAPHPPENLPPGLWLPRNVPSYRAAQGIRQVGQHPAQSWMGCQLRVGHQPIGVIALEDDEQPDVFSQEDFWLLSELCERLGALLHTYWLDELRSELAEKLAALQTAGEDLMLLANGEGGEYRLWHATLTLGTAHYGLGFNRAVLFFYEDGARRVRAQMGIGHLTKAAAEEAWEADAESPQSFAEYKQRLTAHELTPTEIEALIRNKVWTLTCEEPSSALYELYQTGAIVQLTPEEATARLPTAYTASFGVHAYSLVPVKAGTETLGVVILDMAYTGAPHRRELLGYFDVLTNQAALIHENLQRGRQLEELVEVTYRSLSSTASEPLVDILNNIAASARQLLKADLASIYPVRSMRPLTFDLASVGIDGHSRDSLPTQAPKEDGFTAMLLMRHDILAISDVAAHTPLYHGRPLAAHPFIAAEGIRSLIAVPVLGVRFGTPRGVLYLDFREKRSFTQREIKFARTFAKLAALAIRQSHEFGLLEEELFGLGEVLKLALTPDANRGDVIAVALRNLRGLFQLGKLHLVLSMLEWQREPATGTPRLTRQQYFLDYDDRIGERSVTKDIFRGISGLAMHSGAQQVAQDVEAPAWKEFFYDSGIGARAEIDTPITTSDGQVQGVLTIESPFVEAFSERHAGMASRFAAAIGLIVESGRRQDQMRRVLEAADTIMASAEVDKSLEAIAAAIQATAPDLPTLTIWYLDPAANQLRLGAHFGVKGIAQLRRERPGPQGVVRTIMARVEPIWAEDARTNALLRKSKFFQRENFASVAAFPLRAQEETVGAMFFSYRERHVFSQPERTLFRILSQIVAANIQEALLLQMYREENRHHDAQIKVADIIGSNLELATTVRRILDSLQTLFPQAIPCLLIYHPDDEQLHFAPGVREVYRPSDGTELPASLALDDDSIAGSLARLSRTMKRKLMVNIGDVDDCQSFSFESEEVQGVHPRVAYGAFPGRHLRLQRRTQSQISVTLYSSTEERLVGVLVLESEDKRAFDEQDIFSLWGIAKQIRFAIQRAQQTTQLRRKEIIASATAWAADIAHDINRETGILHHAIYELRKEQTLTPTARAYLDELEQAAFRLAGVTAPTGWRIDSNAPVHLSELLEQLALRQIQKRSAPVALHVRGPESGPVFVKANRDGLAMVIRNLVRNSLEAMAGRADQQLTFHIRPPQEGHVVVIVEDNGPGISDLLIRQNLFLLPTTSRGDGHGFGLLLVQDALERLGGKIRLLPYSDARGAEFEITLPLVDAEVKLSSS